MAISCNVGSPNIEASIRGPDRRRRKIRGVSVHHYPSPDGFGPVSRWVYRRDPVLFTTELTTLRTSKWPTDQLLVAAYDCEGRGRGAADA